MKAKPMGMLWMIPAGWPDHLLKAEWPGRKALPQGSLVARMRKLTLLGDAVQGIRRAAAEEWAGKISRRQRLVGIPDLSGERHRLFGVGEGPAEAKQVSMGVKGKQFVKKFVSEQWILSCKSLGRPLVYHL